MHQAAVVKKENSKHCLNRQVAASSTHVFCCCQVVKTCMEHWQLEQAFLSPWVTAGPWLHSLSPQTNLRRVVFLSAVIKMTAHGGKETPLKNPITLMGTVWQDCPCRFKWGPVSLLTSVTLSQSHQDFKRYGRLILTDVFGSDGWTIDEVVYGLIWGQKPWSRKQ